MHAASNCSSHSVTSKTNPIMTRLSKQL
jgi:hypothetical protein